MTLIETYDRSPLQNIAACLAIRPERLVLVGSDSDLEAAAERYRNLLKKRHLSVTVDVHRIDAVTFDDVQASFVALIKATAPCTIDLFGGNETYLAAAGAAYHQLKDGCDVTLQQMNITRGVMMPIDAAGNPPMLSVKESVALHGGVVFSDGTSRLDHCSSADITPLWNLAKSAPTLWNKKLRALNFFETHSSCGRDTLCVTVDLSQPHHGSSIPAESHQLFCEILDDLEQIGAITIEQRKNDRYRYRYAGRWLRDCLEKAGNILEYKTLLMAREYAPDGHRFFNDCRMGVMLDWDGILHNQNGPDVRDTRNEIDILAMRGMIPVFISCKNGSIEDEELYKLNTVAERLGGKFAKKVLVATDYEPASANAKKSMIQRAKDMHILFEADAATYDDEDWYDLFDRIFKDTF